MNDEIKFVNFAVEDRNGDIVTNGDEIIVEIPAWDGPANAYDDNSFFYSYKKVKARLTLQLSKGLIIKILSLIEGDFEDDSTVKIGSILTFRRKTWKWHKAKRVMK